MPRSSALPHLEGDPRMRSRLGWYVWKPPVWTPIALTIASAVLTFGGFFLALGLSLMTMGLTSVFEGARPSAIATNLLTMASCCLPGIVTFGLAVALWYWPRRLRRQNAATEAEFDAQVRADLAWLEQRGLERACLARADGSTWSSGDAEILREPLELTRGLWPDDLRQTQHIPEWTAVARRGSDGCRRHRLYRTTIVYVAQHHLAQYVCEFDVTTGLIYTEKLTDAHYKDVVALTAVEVSTEHIELPVWWLVARTVLRHVRLLAAPTFLFELALSLFAPLQKYVLHTFDIELTSGHALQVPFFRDRGREDLASQALPAHTNINTETINSLRLMLREKRQGIVRVLPAAA